MMPKKKGRWQAGQSGNPKGRPPGTSEISRLRAAIAEHMPDIVAQLVQKAREGDTQAARLLLERVLPPVKATEQAVEIDLPDKGGLIDQASAIVLAISEGQIAPGQGTVLLAGLGSVAKIRETEELADRITALEAEVKK